MSQVLLSVVQHVCCRVSALTYWGFNPLMTGWEPSPVCAFMRVDPVINQLHLVSVLWTADMQSAAEMIVRMLNRILFLTRHLILKGQMKMFCMLKVSFHLFALTSREWRVRASSSSSAHRIIINAASCLVPSVDLRIRSVDLLYTRATFVLQV